DGKLAEVGSVVGRAGVANKTAQAGERELIARIQRVVDLDIDGVILVRKRKVGKIVAGGRVGGGGRKRGLQRQRDVGDLRWGDDVEGRHTVQQSLEGGTRAVRGVCGVGDVLGGGAQFIGEVAHAI